jgi:RimJ/RimL family protein N-acetyltransferase
MHQTESIRSVIMGLFKKRPPEDHTWLSNDNPVSTDRVIVVPLSRNLDAAYIALIDGDFTETHRWPPELLRFVKRSLGANDRIRSSYTRHVAVVVPADTPEQVIGAVSVERAHPDIPGPHFLRVHLLAEQRRTGITTALLPEVITRLKRADLKDVVIATSKDNAAMNGVCKKLNLSYKNVDHEYPDGQTEKTRYYRVIRSK